MNGKHWIILTLAMGLLALGLCIAASFAAEAPPAPPPGPAPPAPPAPPGPAPTTAERPSTPTAPSTPAKAATTAAAAKEPKKTSSFLDTINKGGIIGYMIIVLSFVALALIIEHAVTIRRDKLCPDELSQELEDYFNEEQYEEALELCNVERNLLTDVVRAGLSRIDSGYERMNEAMQEAGEEASVGLQQKISYLSLIGNIAPMMGLLGTVSGMVRAFGIIAAEGGAVKPAVLAGGINEALVTTLLGLTVAIPVMCAYQFFSNRVTRIVLESSTVISDMMERFKPAT